MSEENTELQQGETTKFFGKALDKADKSKVGLIYFLHTFQAHFWIDLILVAGVIWVTLKFFNGDFKLDNSSAMAAYTAFLTGAVSLIGRGGSYKKESPDK